MAVDYHKLRCDAWRDYKNHCQRATDYDAVEPWAWTELQATLAKITKAKQKNRRPAKVA